MVFHQWHYSGPQVDGALVEMNKQIWLQIEQEPGYRAIHLITPDL
jgi:hypothetical protein